MHEIDSWREERQSAYLYRVIAEIEAASPRRQQLFIRLAEAAENQAETWVRLAAEKGLQLPHSFHPPLRVRVVIWLLHRFGPRPLIQVLAAMKVRGLSVYTQPQHALSEHPTPTSVDVLEKRHAGLTGGGNLRAAIFGINDGLVSNASLILGVAGAALDNAAILLTGLAGLLAGAASMASGEYVSVRSQREMFEYQIGLEKDELDAYPEEEAMELALIYEARGLDADKARELADTVISDPERALDALAREELGLNPDELGSPWGAAISSFLAFGFGALVPLVPYFFGHGERNLEWTVGLTLLSLFGVGAATSLFTGRSAWRSGLRMVLIGGAAGAVTYALGHFLGVNLG